MLDLAREIVDAGVARLAALPVAAPAERVDAAPAAVAEAAPTANWMTISNQDQEREPGQAGPHSIDAANLAGVAVLAVLPYWDRLRHGAARLKSFRRCNRVRK